MDPADARIEALHEHQQLLGECEALRPILNSDLSHDVAVWAASCRKHFHRLHVYLREHMFHEEAGGFMRDVLEQRPTLTNKVNALKREHAEIRSECEAIENALLHEETVTPEQAADLVKRIVALIERVHRHERAENYLLQDAFFDDIGTKD